jgi:hypothetical protein
VNGIVKVLVVTLQSGLPETDSIVSFKVSATLVDGFLKKKTIKLTSAVSF